MQEHEIIAAVDAALEEGRFGPGQRASLIELGSKNPSGLRQLLAATPQLTLNEIERDVALAMGLDPVKFLETKKRAIREGRWPKP